MTATLLKSPFFDLLNRREGWGIEQYLAGKIEDRDYIEWNGYLLPNDYGDSQFEYRSIRDECAIFDVSPLRKYRIRGPEAGAFLDYLLTRPASHMQSMRAVYVAFCNADGSLRDDAILHKYSDDDYLLLPSDMDHSAHFSRLSAERGFNDINIDDCTSALAGIAVQGPASATVVKALGLEDVALMEPMSIRDCKLAGGTMRIGRVGFTADLGYECLMRAELVSAFADRIRSARQSLGLQIPGYGLMALQACRLEGGFIVAGWDCATGADPKPGFERSPFELGLEWLVNLDGKEFFGREALLQERQSGALHTIRSFRIQSHIQPTEGTELLAEIEGKEQVVGSINCSAWSWDLDCMIGNASILRSYMDLTRATARQDRQEFEVQLSKGPLRHFDRARQVPAPLEIG